MKKIFFVQTPASWDELQERIDQLPPGEKNIAALYAGMAWNIGCDIYNAEKENMTRPPERLNGHRVLAFAPYHAQLGADPESAPENFIVLVSMPDNELTPFVVAHWNPGAAYTWHNGAYCADYDNALELFTIRAGGRYLIGKPRYNY
jgi:hypothetical protein